MQCILHKECSSTLFVHCAMTAMFLLGDIDQSQLPHSDFSVRLHGRLPISNALLRIQAVCLVPGEAVALHTLINTRLLIDLPRILNQYGRLFCINGSHASKYEKCADCCDDHLHNMTMLGLPKQSRWAQINA